MEMLGNRSFSLGYAALLAVAGCGVPSGVADDDSDEHEPPAATDDLDVCGFEEPTTARFRVEEAYANPPMYGQSARHAQVSARLLAEPLPSQHVTTDQGSCRLSILDISGCDLGCGPTELCSIEEGCVPYPVGISGGALTLAGLDQDLTIEPETYNPGLYYGPEDLPEDLFDDGDRITATLAGDAFPALQLAARGVVPMDGDLADGQGLTLPFDEDLELLWSSGPDEDACVRLLIRAPTLGHSLNFTAMLSCSVPDTGGLVVPRELLELLPESTCTSPYDAGSDCYGSELTRYTSQTVATPAGLATLEVSSAVYFFHHHVR
jgi:hypothetical protein